MSMNGGTITMATTTQGNATGGYFMGDKQVKSAVTGNKNQKHSFLYVLHRKATNIRTGPREDLPMDGLALLLLGKAKLSKVPSFRDRMNQMATRTNNNDKIRELDDEIAARHAAIQHAAIQLTATPEPDPAPTVTPTLPPPNPSHNSRRSTIAFERQYYWGTPILPKIPEAPSSAHLPASVGRHIQADNANRRRAPQIRFDNGGADGPTDIAHAPDESGLTNITPSTAERGPSSVDDSSTTAERGPITAGESSNTAERGPSTAGNSSTAKTPAKKEIKPKPKVFRSKSARNTFGVPVGDVAEYISKQIARLEEVAHKHCQKRHLLIRGGELEHALLTETQKERVDQKARALLKAYKIAEVRMPQGAIWSDCTQSACFNFARKDFMYTRAKEGLETSTLNSTRTVDTLVLTAVVK